MNSTAYWDKDQNSDVIAAVRRRIHGMAAWKTGDIELWGEYAAWAISNANSHYAARAYLSEVLSKMVHEDVRSGAHKPGWEMLWDAGSDQQPEAVRVLYRLARKHFKSPSAEEVQPHYLMPHGEISAWDLYADCAAIVMAGARAEAIAETPVPLDDMSETLSDTLRVVAWKMVLAEIIPASREAGGLAFGTEHPSLRALCTAKYGDAVERLLSHIDPESFPSLEQRAATFGADVEWLVFGGSDNDKDETPFRDHVKYDINKLKTHHRPQEKK